MVARTRGPAPSLKLPCPMAKPHRLRHRAGVVKVLLRAVDRRGGVARVLLGGSEVRGGTLIVNTACGYALVEWAFGTCTLVRQERLVLKVTED